MLDKLKTYYKKIFRRTSEREQLTFHSWDSTQYYACVYQIAKIKEDPPVWTAFACLFFGSPQEKLHKEKVLLVPLNLKYTNPEACFIHLTSFGPLFYNLSETVMITEPIKEKEHHFKVVKIWYLNKSLVEQGVCESEDQFIELDKSSDEEEIIATHRGPISIN